MPKDVQIDILAEQCKTQTIYIHGKHGPNCFVYTIVHCDIVKDPSSLRAFACFDPIYVPSLTQNRKWRRRSPSHGLASLSKDYYPIKWAPVVGM